jgi:ribosomal protein S18 acetylase RimI-like enzyme
MAEDLLVRIDAYFDAVARRVTRAESIGPFTLFVRETQGWPFYARPTPGASGFARRDVDAVRRRQRGLGIPEAFELVEDLSPGAAEAIAASGLRVNRRPLMALAPAGFAPLAIRGSGIRFIGAGDDDLVRVVAVQQVGFGSPGTAAGDAGVEALDAAATGLPTGHLQATRDGIGSGRTVVASAFVDGEPVATGAHQPVDGVTEVVGVATLPAFRRRGLGAALTSALVADAFRRGVELACLSASDEAVARVYARLGFRTVGTFVDAELPAPVVAEP